MPLSHCVAADRKTRVVKSLNTHKTGCRQCAGWMQMLQYLDEGWYLEGNALD